MMRRLIHSPSKTIFNRVKTRLRAYMRSPSKTLWFAVTFSLCQWHPLWTPLLPSQITFIMSS